MTKSTGHSPVRRRVVLAVCCCLAAAILGIAFIVVPNFRTGEAPLRHVVATVPDSGQVSLHLILGMPPADAGLAHYVEHLAWLNSVANPGKGNARHSNAWTGEISVGYWLDGEPQDLDEMLETLSNIFAPIDLPRKFAEEERNIIQREYERSIAGNINARADEAMNEFLYRNNQIATSLIGTPNAIMAFEYDDARALHAATHWPGNTTLVAIGDVTERQVLRALRKLKLPEPRDDVAKIGLPQFELAAPTETVLQFPSPDATRRMIWRRVIELETPVQFDLLEAQTALLRDILDTSLPGGLAGPLRFDAFVARNLDIGVWPIDENSVEMRLTAIPDSDVTFSELRSEFEDTLNEIAVKGLPHTTFSRILDRFDGFWPDWDDKDETANWMADYAFDRISLLRDPLPKSELKLLAGELSLETTNDLLRRLSGEGRTAVVLIGLEDLVE